MYGAANDQPLASLGAVPGVADAEALPEGIQHLAVRMANVRCYVPLSQLRGVLAESPTLVRFPFGPPWLLGVFLQRNEVIALVDPVPVLSGGAGEAASDAAALWTSRGSATYTAVRAGKQTILVGNADQTLAFRVDEVFAVLFLPEKIATPADMGQSGALEGIARRYVAGMWAPDEMTVPYSVLAVDPLLEDLAVLLAEEGRDG